MNEKKPTRKQIAAWYNLTYWQLANDIQHYAIEVIKKRFTRAELSKEISRIRVLYIERKLNEDNIFESALWKKHKEEERNAK